MRGRRCGAAGLSLSLACCPAASLVPWGVVSCPFADSCFSSCIHLAFRFGNCFVSPFVHLARRLWRSNAPPRKMGPAPPTPDVERDWLLDRENPKTWSLASRLFHTAIPAVYCFVAYVDDMRHKITLVLRANRDVSTQGVRHVCLLGRHVPGRRAAPCQ